MVAEPGANYYTVSTSTARTKLDDLNLSNGEVCCAWVVAATVLGAVFLVSFLGGVVAI